MTPKEQEKAIDIAWEQIDMLHCAAARGEMNHNIVPLVNSIANASYNLKMRYYESQQPIEEPGWEYHGPR